LPPDHGRSDLNYESSDLFALPMTGEDRTPIVIANTPAEERMGEFSPDGRWIAYQTAESGQPEIVVRAFPESKGIDMCRRAAGRHRGGAPMGKSSILSRLAER
jgi:hypothetical protein